MNYAYHPDARDELVASAAHYESRREGLGEAFLHEVNLAVRKVIDHPARWPTVQRDVRRCQINRFPFGVIYEVMDDTIYVLAIADLRRRPFYWRKRRKAQ